MKPAEATTPSTKTNFFARRWQLLAAILAVVVLLLAVWYAVSNRSAINQDTSLSASAQITITKNGFSPSTLKIKKGQQVTWKNTDIAFHQPASTTIPSLKSEDTAPLQQEESITLTFEK